MRARELIAAGALVAALALLGAEPALAKSSLGIGSAEVSAQPSGGLFGPLFSEIAIRQRAFFTALRKALISLKQDGAALPFLVGLSFVYGVFHAAGPGHGKAVISSYMLANEVELRRGILLSFASSFVQALSALIVVGAGWYLLRGTGVSMTEATDALELASYALIALFGGWLLARKLWRVLGGRPAAARLLAWSMPRRGGAPATGGLAFAAPAAPRDRVPASMRPASSGMAAGVCADSQTDCGCGRTHMPAPNSLGGRMTLSSASAAVLAVGLRPCSGAIVVLTFALLNSLYVGGVLSVLAMALGTAITVSALASLAVFAKGAALRFGGDGALSRHLGTMLELAGATALLLLGLLLLGGALQTV